MEPILITLINLINLGVILSFILYCVADILIKSKQIVDYLHKIDDNTKNDQSTQYQQPEPFSNYETTPNMIKRLGKEAKKIEREEKENDM
jgi:hypothetical protein